MRRGDPLILGGGPAGAAAAIGLARGGVRALVIERQRETGDALCGGFLSWQTLARLDALGLPTDRLNGHAITRLRVFTGSTAAEARLPAPAIGLTRRRLDGLLLDQASALGAGIERVTVSTVEAGADDDTYAVRLADGATITAASLFLATGKHNLRGLPPRAPGGIDPALGLRLRLAASPAIARMIGDAIELHLFDRCYIGINLHEDGSANLCLAARKSLLAEAGGDPRQLLIRLAEQSPPLAERMAFADSDDRADAIAAVPYGWRTATTIPGLFRLGDQAAVIPSLAGEGIGIAIGSAAAAVAAWQRNGDGGAAGYQAAFAREAARPVQTASLLYALSETAAGRAIIPRLIGSFPILATFGARATRLTLRAA